MPAVLAAAAAAAGLGAIAVSAGSAPWTNAISGVAMDAPVVHVSSAGHPSVAFDSVLGAQPAKLTKTTVQPRHSGGVQLDSRVASATPGFAGTLGPATGGADANSSPLPIIKALEFAAQPSAPRTEAAPAKPAQAPARTDALAAHAAPANAAPAAPAHPAPAAPAHAAPAAPAHAAPAHPAAAAPARHVQAPPPVTKPFEIYDSVTPSSIPPGYQVATYVNGDYAAPAASVAGRGNILWIDTNGSDPNANALDVEPGDATPAGAATWIQERLDANHSAIAIVYTMIDDWQAVRDSVSTLPHWMQNQVRYWIADPTGVPHVLPGSNATQWYWGNSYDISTANPGFES